MRVFYDTEFLDTGTTIDLISIGLVAEDGHEYYAVNSDAPWDRIREHRWLCENVVPTLPLRPDSFGSPIKGTRAYYFAIDMADTRVKPHWVIANEVRAFILGVPRPELWAWYAAHDHVVLCQLWGGMTQLPDGIPRWTADLKQEATRLGNPRMPRQTNAKHNALADARHVKVMADFLASLGD